MAEITLPTSQEVREKLEKAGWKLIRSGFLYGVHIDPYHYEEWVKHHVAAGPSEITVHIGGYISNGGFHLDDVAEFAAITGIQIPGYRLVPEDVAEKALPFVKGLAEDSACELLDVGEGLAYLHKLGAFAEPPDIEGAVASARETAQMWEAIAEALSPSKEVK